MNYGELDRSRWYGFSEPAMASLSVYGSISSGESVAAAVRQLLRINNRTFPPNARYLALAAGEAHAEMALARGTGVKPSNVTLIDKAFRLDTLSRLRQQYPHTEMVESGMFDYLQQAQGQQFHVARALGIEYVLTSREHAQELLKLLRRVLTPDGVVVLSPFPLTYQPVTGYRVLRLDHKGGIFLNFDGQKMKAPDPETPLPIGR